MCVAGEVGRTGGGVPVRRDRERRAAFASSAARKKRGGGGVRCSTVGAALSVGAAALGRGGAARVRGVAAWSIQFTFLQTTSCDLCVRGAHAHVKPDRLEVCARRDPHALYVYRCVRVQCACTHRAGARPLVPESQCTEQRQGRRAPARESARAETGSARTLGAAPPVGVR